MLSPVIESLMVRGSQVALKHVIHDMEARTLVMELRRLAIKRWVPCGDMDRRLKIPHSASWSVIFKGHVYSCMTCDDLIQHVMLPLTWVLCSLPISIARRRLVIILITLKKCPHMWTPSPKGLCYQLQ